jgi:hypothetical protein
MRSSVEGVWTVEAAGAERSRGCVEVSTTHAGSGLGAEVDGEVVLSWGDAIVWCGGWWVSNARRAALNVIPLAADDEAERSCEIGS